MPPWILPAGPSAETGIVFPDARSSAHDCQRCCTNWRAWKSVSSRWNGPPKRWGRRSPWMNARTWQGCEKWPPPCIWAWMAPGCPCARKKSQTARASKPTARPKPAKPSWSLSGRRNREIGKANPCAIQDRSAIRVRLKAPPLRIPAPTCRILPRAYSARPAAAVSPKPCVRWCWAMARPGFGTRLPNCSRKPLRFSIAFMPKNISAKWERSFMETAPRARHGSMHVVQELDEGHLKSLVHTLRSHIGQHKEARECIQYIWRNRRHMRYTQFEHQGFCTSTGVVESGCKIVVGTRLKRAGMHWTVKGANAIIALRCSKLSGRFQDFWERRSERKQVAA